jgi:hypothetical protein
MSLTVAEALDRTAALGGRLVLDPQRGPDGSVRGIVVAVEEKQEGTPDVIAS